MAISAPERLGPPATGRLHYPDFTAIAPGLAPTTGEQNPPRRALQGRLAYFQSISRHRIPRNRPAIGVFLQEIGGRVLKGENVNPLAPIGDLL